MKTVAIWVTALLAGCSSCAGEGPQAEMDAAPDADADADGDADTDVDTTWDAGPLTPCAEDAGVGAPDFVCIPGGSYLMGCMPYDTQCTEEELPRVVVKLSPFWIDKKEATYADLLPFLNHLASLGPEAGVECGFSGCVYVIGEWPYPVIFVAYSHGDEQFIEMNDAGVFEWSWESYFEDECKWVVPETPAGGLGWWGAKLFCEWRGMRLPTEAEWEAAARGRTQLVWPCAAGGIGCFDAEFGQCNPGDECADPEKYNCCVPVNNPGWCVSPDGVIGAAGNAAEWVLDWGTLGTGHEWCADGCEDPKPRQGNRAVFKGGKVHSDVESTRVSSREALLYNETAYNGSQDTGVRCVKSAVSHALADGGVDWAE